MQAIEFISIRIYTMIERTLDRRSRTQCMLHKRKNIEKKYAIVIAEEGYQ